MSELIGLQAPVKPTAPADVIIDGTEATFAQDVIEASMERPVIVDFWAEWCVVPVKRLVQRSRKS